MSHSFVSLFLFYRKSKRALEHCMPDPSVGSVIQRKKERSTVKGQREYKSDFDKKDRDVKD